VNETLSTALTPPNAFPKFWTRRRDMRVYRGGCALRKYASHDSC
jgi:hypothetical protein